ncbi:hypothetical protein JNO48_07360 [Clostridiales bacterium]|nr:hypothetical protein JNO48_07360 [Clostridiales bacterium]
MSMGKKSIHSIYYEFGYQKFGPFLFGFSKWLKKHIDNKNYNKVFFFSRDGYMMKKAYDLIDEKKNATEYVYFSRKSLRQALLWKTNSFEESLKYLSWERFVSVGKLLEYFGFNEEERHGIAESNNLDLNRDLAFDDIATDSEISQLYFQYKDIIFQKSEIQSNLLLKYINQIGMNDHFAIVDIGWHGSMQYYLELFLYENGLEATIDGYYVGILPNVPIKNNAYGYIYDKSRPQKRKDTLCFFGCLERLFQGFEGSTSGYKLNINGEVDPVLDQYEYINNEDIVLVDHIKEWQQAALDYIQASLSIEKTTENYNELVQPLMKFGKTPTLMETKIFEGFYIYDGAKRYFISEKKIFQYKPKELIHALSNSPWKTGFMKSAFKIPFPYYRIYEVIRK